MVNNIINDSVIKDSTLETVQKALRYITIITEHAETCQCCKDALKGIKKIE